MEEAARIKSLPPYLFARIDEKVAEAKAKGIDVISLGIGDPDLPTPEHICQKAAKEVFNPEHHRYPSYVGMPEYRQAVAKYYQQRFNVALDANKEVVSLIGSKEGIAHIAWCYLNPGDVALVPDPGYPVYSIGTTLTDSEAYRMPLLEENGFLPDFSAIPPEVAQKAKLLFLNYPNNPTAAVADAAFYQQAIAFAKQYDIIICHDAAYQEIYFDGYKPISFLEVAGAKDVGIEFGSLSKTYNMTGWRIGWAAGNARVIEALGRVKSNIDSGVFQAVQVAAIEALLAPQDCVADMRHIYTERRDILIDGLNAMGWKLAKTKATIYVWAKVPPGFTSSSFAEFVLEKCGVIVTPGNGYGEYGEGYFRISLTIGTERLKEAIARMQANLGTVKFS